MPESISYTFDDSVDMEEVGGTLALAVMAAESMFGETTVTLEARYQLKPHRGVCEIEASCEVGRALNRLFNGFIRREFGARHFTARRTVIKSQAVTAA